MDPSRDKIITEEIESLAKQVDETSAHQVKIIDIFAEQMRQTANSNFESLDHIEDDEQTNAKNDYDNFLTPQAI
jgi:hypothetical protein